MLPIAAPPRRVWPVDILHFCFFGLLLIATCVTFGRLPHRWWWVAFDLVGPGALLVLEAKARTLGAGRGALLRLAHGVVVVPLVFTQVGMLIHAGRHVDHAATLERIDRVLFLGANPIEALERWSRAWITEIMQWAYTSYLFLPVGLVLLLAWKARGTVVSRSLFALLGVMYLSYLGYFIVPAAGPNIHNLAGPLKPVAIDVTPLYRFGGDLPGVWLAGPLREWMFDVELTKKDCFPSGHVAVAIVCFFLARGIDRRFALPFGVLAGGVTLSTVYLRYHYVIDVIAGGLLAWFALTGWLRVHDWLSEKLNGGYKGIS